MNHLRFLLLAVLVTLCLLPGTGLPGRVFLEARFAHPPRVDWQHVVWVPGTGGQEVPREALATLLSAGPRLLVCAQGTCPAPTDTVVVQDREPVPGKGAPLIDAEGLRGTLVETAALRLGLEVPGAGLLWRVPRLDYGHAPARLPLEGALADPAKLRGRVVVVGDTDLLTGPRTPSRLHEQLSASNAVAWGLGALLGDGWIRQPRRGLEVLLALLLAAWVWAGVDRGRAEGRRRAALVSGGVLLAWLATLGLGILVDPLAPLVGAWGAVLLAPGEDPEEGRRRLLAALSLLAGKGELPTRDALLATLPEPLRDGRGELYDFLTGVRPEVPVRDPRWIAEELVAVARRLDGEEQLDARLEYLEWAFLAAPEDSTVRELLEETRDEILGGLALLDLDGIKGELHARFTDLRLVGQGAMGLILAGRDAALDRPVAVKVVNPAILDDADGQERFFREIEALAQLTHPHVVQIYGAYPGKVPHYAMEYLVGETLREVLARKGLAPGAARILLAQFAEALDFIHDRGIIHRDLKPDNLLLVATAGSSGAPGSEGAGEPSGAVPWQPEGLRLVVIDFGVAKGTWSRALTRVGDVLGTLAYMAPEQVRGDAAGPAADRFALGVIAHEVLAGEPPFKTPGAAASGPVRPLAQVRPDLPPELTGAVAALLDPDPASRPPDLSTLRDSLAGASFF